MSAAVLFNTENSALISYVHVVGNVETKGFFYFERRLGLLLFGNRTIVL